MRLSISTGELTIEQECEQLLEEMKRVGVPPHLAGLISTKKSASASGLLSKDEYDDVLQEDVDPGSTFSDTITGNLLNNKY